MVVRHAHYNIAEALGFSRQDIQELLMLIVAGKIYVKPGFRDVFLQRSMPALQQARATPGCKDFVVSPDPLEQDRVNIYEAWETDADLLRFREGGLGDELGSLIVNASVSEFIVK
jgi:quinol monooxygenase YgiN